jgi:hypothetical protein
MNKIVVIHQPDFLPYLGFFHRLLFANLYIILDNVQFVNSSRSWTKRDKIKTMHGVSWLTISVKKAPRVTKINEILLSYDNDWRTDNLNLIYQNYNNTPFFSEIYPQLERLYTFQFEKMIDFNVKSIEMLIEMFNIKIETCFASALNTKGSKNELLIDLLKKVNATHYLSGIGAKNYFVSEPFDNAGIDVIWQDFKHPVYPQLFGEFIPFLSSIDLLFNCGIEISRKIIRSC